MDHIPLRNSRPPGDDLTGRTIDQIMDEYLQSDFPSVKRESLCCYIFLSIFSCTISKLRSSLDPIIKEPDDFRFIRFVGEKQLLFRINDERAFTIPSKTINKLLDFRNYALHYPNKITAECVQSLNKDIKSLLSLPDPIGPQFKEMSEILRIILSIERSSVTVHIEGTYNEFKRMGRQLIYDGDRIKIKSGEWAGRKVIFICYSGNQSFTGLVINNMGSRFRVMIDNNAIIKATIPLQRIYGEGVTNPNFEITRSPRKYLYGYLSLFSLSEISAYLKSSLLMNMADTKLSDNFLIDMIEHSFTYTDLGGDKYKLPVPRLVRLLKFRNLMVHTPDDINDNFLNEIRLNIFYLECSPSPVGYMFTLMRKQIENMMDQPDPIDNTLVMVQHTIGELKNMNRDILPSISKVRILDGKYKNLESRFLRYNGNNSNFYIFGHRDVYLKPIRRLELNVPQFMMC